MAPIPQTEPTLVDRVVQRTLDLPGVIAEPHRFGGREFRLGNREIGHVHANGFVDINFPRRLRDALVESGRTEPHHLYPDSGWTTFHVTVPANVQLGVDLLRISYLYHAAALSKRDETIPAPDLERELADLGVSTAVNEAFAPVA
ncbi:luciferase family protein [Halorarius litoreus]|uniref:luciferase domain-containing protein n=1 Tax=Halorarius litoreus TaxID=2962676 RepID=UPI0020CB764C|nr:luciferase family protein [Halorarius litoreus]